MFAFLTLVGLLGLGGFVRWGNLFLVRHDG
jgi:hypothetical protein